jgi:polysaccharide biosynthesis transport protein
MSVQFRQRKPAEYIKIALKRKWLIILPVIAVTTAVGWVVHRLPDVYESSTLIVVKPSTLPNTVVTPTTEEGLSRQLHSIATVVTSRSSLEPLVDKYRLYQSEKARGVPIETIIDQMRVDIKVEVNTSRNDITNGFNISYRGREPRTTQAVAADLASKYVDAQTKDNIAATTSAKNFIDGQVLETKEALDKIDKQRLDFMQKNVGNLPSEALTLVGQLNGLREQQKAYITEVGRLQDRRSALQSNLVLLKQQTEQMRSDIAKNVTDPKTTLAWSQLVMRRAQLEGELTRLLNDLRPKHPDVIAKQKEVDNVKEQMDQMIAEWKDKIKQEEEKLRDRPDIAAANAQNEINLVEGEIGRQQKMLADIQTQINAVVARINSVPGAEVTLGALDREYQTKKAAYDALLVKQQTLQLNADAASQQQGEVIQVIDAANLPTAPVAPKRMMLTAIGLVFGLAIGFFLAALLEVPRLLTIQTSEDVRHYTGLPVLISVPQLLTTQEARAIPRRRRLLLAAGVAVTIASIPLLAFVLKATHVFEILMTSGRA